MATRKAAVPKEEKFEHQDFDLFKAIDAVDKKDYNFLSSMTEEQQRKFSPYMMLHWISVVTGGRELSSYYLISTDVHANKYMFNERIQNHPELQWLMLCAGSPDMGKQYHKWIPHLNDKIGKLRDKAKQADVLDYFEKVFKNEDKATIKLYASEFTKQQNHKYRLAKMHPEMKLEDLELLSEITSGADVDDYDTQAGN